MPGMSPEEVSEVYSVRMAAAGQQQTGDLRRRADLLAMRHAREAEDREAEDRHVAAVGGSCSSRL